MTNYSDENGFIKVHWDLLKSIDLTAEEVLFYEYLVAVYNSSILEKNAIVVDGKEYRRISDSFIGEIFEYSSPTIRRLISKLENLGYISIVKNRNKKVLARYYRINEKNNENINEKNFHCNDSDAVTNVISVTNCYDNESNNAKYSENINESINEKIFQDNKKNIKNKEDKENKENIYTDSNESDTESKDSVLSLNKESSINPVKNFSKEPRLKRYGYHRNIYLTEEDYKELTEEFTERDFNSYMIEFSGYLQRNGYSLTDYKEGIRRWSRGERGESIRELLKTA